jgi:hypothetical protein
MAVIGNSYVNIIDELKGQALGPVVNMLRLYNTIYEGRDHRFRPTRACRT